MKRELVWIIVKICVFVTAFIALSLLHMGAQWQHEIAMLNMTNGWEFGWLFCMWMMNPWQAMDFFRAVQDVCNAAIGITGFGFGFWLCWTILKTDWHSFR